MRANSLSLGQIAKAIDGQLVGNPVLELVGIASLEEAQSNQLSFLHNDRYAPLLKKTRAGAVLIGDHISYEGVRIICTDPHRAYAKAMQLFYPSRWPKGFVSPQAYIAKTAELAEEVHIEAFAWIGEGVRIGKGAWIQSGVRIGAGSSVGERCKLMANSVVGADCHLEDRVWLNPGAVIGAEGFGFVPAREGVVKVPQVGTVLLEEDVEVGANSCVDRAALGQTKVGRQSKLDNFVQIGHGAQLGERSLLVAYAALAGSARVGKRVLMAGRSSVLGHVELQDDSRVGVLGVVNRNQRGTLSGFPAINHSKWLRATTAFKELPDVLKRLRVLERKTSGDPE